MFRGCLALSTVAAAIVTAAAAVASNDALDCFVEFRSSSTIKNMCVHRFYTYPEASTPLLCAELCVADSRCIMFGWETNSKGGKGCRLSSTCTAPTNALAGYDGYFRNSSTGTECAPRPTPPPAPPGIPGTWSRVFLDDAAAKGAVCIDGSPAAYYIRTANADGVKADPTKWVVFMEGGGWASSLAGTVDRAKTDLGSSKKYPVVPTHM